jgi:hypothetical protein
LWTVVDLKAFLAGDWRIERTIRDRRNSIHGRLRGEARFTSAGDALHYVERGTLQFGRHEGRAEQHYAFAFPDGCERARVRFRDGRDFHELDLSSGVAAVTHSCGLDLYEGRFTALDGSQWRSAWKVAGPRKDQDIVTNYTRLT